VSARVPELLCLLNSARINPCIQGRIEDLVSEMNADATSEDEWRDFFALAESNSAQVLAARRLDELGIQKCNPAWRAEALRIRRAGERRAEWLAEILRQSALGGIDVVLLKGGLFGPVLYGDPAYKKMNDIDILVRPESAEAVAEILKALGFSSVGQLLGKKEVDLGDHHSPPFVSPDLSCVIGLHWGLCSPHSVWKPGIEGIWARAQRTRAYGQPAWRMSWEDNLLHLCIHLPFYKTGVRELADVFNLCAHAEPGIDWRRFGLLVTQWRAHDAAYRVLALAQALRPIGVPGELLEQLARRANPFTVFETRKRAALGLDLIRFRSTYIAKIEKAFSVLRLSRCYLERVGAWGKTWQLALWPKEDELLKLFLVPGVPSRLELAWLRLRAPVRCWNALARDYGQLAVVLMTFVNIGIVVKETLLWPWKAPSASILENPAARLLEMLE
jgi:hypothetical protein